MRTSTKTLGALSVFAGVGILCVLLGQGCNGAREKDGRIHVVCTTGMVADLVAKVGGERVVIEQLMGPDVDPHTYQSSLDDAASIQRADIIFYSGLHLEGALATNIEKVKNKPTLAVADAIQANRLLKDEEKKLDPHLWLDVALWAQGTTAVAKALMDFDPSHGQEYAQRAADYHKKLEALHDEVKKKIVTIPVKRRVLVTSHDAFRYFSRAYDIDVKGLQGISTAEGANQGHINELVDFICERGIKAVFVESSVNPRGIRSVLEGCAKKKHTVVEGGVLYSDALGQPGSPAATYEGMIRHNVDTIVKALR